jgi:hypothetical protein
MPLSEVMGLLATQRANFVQTPFNERPERFGAVQLFPNSSFVDGRNHRRRESNLECHGGRLTATSSAESGSKIAAN